MLKLIIPFLAFFAAGASFASTSCSNENFYYSHVQRISGISPEPGSEIGRLVIVRDGKVPVDERYFAGLGQHSPAAYTVSFSDEETIDSDGGPNTGSATYLARATLYQVDQSNPALQTEVAQEWVLCRSYWAIAP